MPWWDMAGTENMKIFRMACQKKFTCQKHSVLYRLKTHSKIVSISLKLLSLGMDPSALEEALEIRESTLRTWLARSGAHGRKLHQRFLGISSWFIFNWMNCDGC